VGNASSPQPVKLLASLVFHDNQWFFAGLEELVSRWGPVDFMSETMSFDFTRYYEEEMGKRLSRRIVTFDPLINPEKLWQIKQVTNILEERFSAEPTKRRINIDPGYLTLHHLILASTKPSDHRPYIQDGIYADLTLIYREKSFHALPWTYPDYRSDRMLRMMNALRDKYRFQLNQGVAHYHPATGETTEL
jgi:hypothetical protein